MTARINLSLTKDEKGFLIDGKRTYDFQAGVEYVVSADENIWVTWKDDAEALTEFQDPENVLNLNNITCVDHHRYTNDALLYYIQFRKVVNLEGIPLGLLNKEVREPVPELVLNEDVIDYFPLIILPQRTFSTNGTFEELFGLEQEEFIQPKSVVFPVNDESYREYYFERSERYLALISNGERVDPDLYQAFFVKNGDFNKISLFEKYSGSVYTRTDLCHNVRENGSKQIRIIVREGDERKFYFNTYDHAYKSSFVGRGKNSPENIVTIRDQFDEYVHSNFPQLYQFLKSYFDYENLETSPSSFLRNMSDFYDVDKMPEDLLRAKIKKVFPFVDNVQVDKRLFAKRMIDFFKNKGNQKSYNWLSNAFFRKSSEIHRYTDDIVRFSASPAKTTFIMPLIYLDLQRLVATKDSVKLGVEYTTNYDLVAQALIGNVFQGRSSGSTALVESFEKVLFQKQMFYKFHCSIKNGEFEDGELLDIRRIDGNINLNRLTSEMLKKGIVGVEVVDGAYGYVTGQEIEAVSLTGEGFKARVINVDEKGSIKNVEVIDSGWFYRENTDTVRVYNDVRKGSVPLDPNKINSASNVRTGEFKWTTLDGEVVETEIVNTNLTIDGRYNINRGQYVFNYPIATARYNNSILFFAKGLDSRSVYAIDQFDIAKKINIHVTSDIVNLYSTGRTLIVVTNSGLISIAVADVFKNNPSTRETLVQSSSGFVRTVFQARNRLFGFTNASIVELDQDGSVISAWPVNRVYDFASFKTNDKVSTLYLGSNKDLYAYQWFEGETKAVLKPVFGNFYKKFEEDESFRNKLSGTSVFSDNDIYQDFSFGIVLDETTDKYMNEYKQLVNLSGYKVTGVHRKEIASIDELQVSTAIS